MSIIQKEKRCLNIELGDNAIEFYKGTDRATVTFTQGKWINKIKRLAIKYPGEVDIKENADGSIFAHIPIRWVKISPPRTVSEEQRKAAGERLRRLRDANNQM